MPSVRILHNNNYKEYQLPYNAPLTELDNVLVFGCRMAACGACVIEVSVGSENLSPLTLSEKKLLEDFGLIEGRYRLSCQCKVLGNITIKQC